jgi:hypothetical protein
MPSFRRTLRSAAKRLTDRLEQLCHALDSITARVRAATAEVVGETITDIVRDAALYVIDRISGPGTRRSSRRAPVNRDRLWSSDEGDDHAEYFDASEFDQDDESGYADDADDLSDQAERISLAVSAGLQIAAWWLKCQAGRGGVLMSMVVSIATTGIAYFAGPFTRSFIVLIESATRCAR